MYRMITFTTRSRRTDPGTTSVDMAAAGGRRLRSPMPPGDHIAIVGAGFIRIVAGIGLQIIRGDGQPFTMAAGFNMQTGAGAGCRVLFGALRG